MEYSTPKVTIDLAEYKELVRLANATTSDVHNKTLEAFLNKLGRFNPLSTSGYSNASDVVSLFYEVIEGHGGEIWNDHGRLHIKYITKKT